VTVDTPQVPAPRVVLITGGGGFLGSELAGRLAYDHSIERVIAVDSLPPDRRQRTTMGRAEFYRSDLSAASTAAILTTARVDTVVHAAVVRDSLRAGSSAAAIKERNVLGTMQLLAACQRAESVRRLVVKSSSAVYGSSARDPALFTEQTAPRQLRGADGTDAVEMEGYVRGFGRRRPDVAITTLRFANVIAPGIRTSLTDYFAMPFVPTVLGHDPRIQLLHSDDAVAVLELAVRGQACGIVNVAAEGVLMLSQALRRVGHLPVPVPVPMVGTVGRLFRGAGLVDFSSEQISFLDFGRVLDCTRLTEKLGYRPQWSTRQAFDDFAQSRGMRPWPERSWARAAGSGAVAVAGWWR